MQITRDESGAVLKIAGTLDIGVAEELRNSLRDALAGDAGLILDLSGIDDCDTTAVQLLYSARKTAVLTRRHFEIIGMPAGVTNRFAELGLPIGDLATRSGESTLSETEPR